MSLLTELMTSVANYFYKYVAAMRLGGEDKWESRALA